MTLAATGLLYGTAPGAILQGPVDSAFSNVLYHSLGKSGVPVVHHQTTVVAPTMRMEVSGHRNGLFLMAFAAASVLLWPASWKMKLAWLFPLLLLAAVLNLARLFSAFLYGVNHGRRAADAFDFWVVLAILFLGVLLEMGKLSASARKTSPQP
jgi:exosortase/archaeosortase family protein